VNAPRVLVVVAHPDDESFGCGSVLAHASSRGFETVVCCATRGEAGECAEGVDLDGRSLGAQREDELRAAARVLGVARVVVLDHRDSGMAGDPVAGSLVVADAHVVAAEVRALVDDVRPDVVVTLDGSDGHRDHVAIRDATLAAVHTPGRHRPARTYLWCLSQQNMARWAEHQRRLDSYGDYTAAASLGTPIDEITTVVDVHRHLDLRWEAIRAHPSQTSPYEGLPADLQEAFLATDHLRRVDPPWSGGPVETDWFPSAGSSSTE
jgi:N-acetyl-1-D-myo-inositol-2-amino-2-deoxy-alpha-D-glucopyranoside deacetylase